MAYEPPAHPHLTAHRHEWWMLFPAAVIAVVTVAAWLSSVLFGDENAETAGIATDWTVPLVSLGGITTMALLLWAAFTAWAREAERRSIRRVYEHGLARWPQYATEAQWRQVIDKTDRPEGNALDVAIPAALLTVVIGAMATVAGSNGLWSLALVLAAFWALLIGLVGGRRWNQERERRADRRRRERLAPVPSCVVAAEGLYHEDHGLIDLDQVTEVRVVPPAEVPGIRRSLLGRARAGDLTVDLDPFDHRLARSGWALLQFTLDERVARTLGQKVIDVLRAGDHARHAMPISVVHVRVPPGHESEADRVAAAVRQRWLSPTDTLW